MSVRLSTRATSLSAAALLLGAAVIAALSMRFIIVPDREGPPPIPAWTEEAPKQPPAQEERKQVRPRDIVEEVAPPITPPAPPVEGSGRETDLVPAGSVFPAGPITITRPDWLRRPTDLEKYYPRRARDRGIEGVVQLECLVQVDGRLNCTVATETPAGWQFGDAAQRIARDHRMAPATRDGVPVEARYRMRVPFNLDER